MSEAATDTRPAKPPPEPVLMTPPRRITRYRPVVVGAIAGGVILLIGAAFIIGFDDRAREKPEAVATSEPGEPPVALETRLPARYDDPGAAPGTAELPPPEGGGGSRPSPAPPPSSSSPAPGPSAEVQAARQEGLAARGSGPFFGGAGAAPTPSPPAASAGPAGWGPAAPSAAPALSAQERFIAAAGARGPTTAILPRPPLSPWEIKAGALISAALITGINSDLPGPVIAQVTAPVFDHRTGSRVLIPQGARLIGRYDSQVGYGQQRVLVVWTQMVFPSGRSVDLGAMVGLDAAGMSGLTGKVDNHLPRLARAIGLSTLISIGGAAAQNSAGRRDDRVVLQDAAGGVASAASQTGQRLVERDLQRAPTLVIAPGQLVRVLIDRDLILPPEDPPSR
ncbi:TrbI/VirB10 family protein [Caulobacter sp.]|uniref:TrbI/VirB10 family protein n=1 Tax=Caulobacter sp. TaxID=78 RepID=UPI001B21E04B|nr:TrbI/VirB10 family protein [Caulobacter sp.]MBO9547132.1 TrbI/VirB10 family protein [Caulobacter sp.]